MFHKSKKRKKQHKDKILVRVDKHCRRIETLRVERFSKKRGGFACVCVE